MLFDKRVVAALAMVIATCRSVAVAHASQHKMLLQERVQEANAGSPSQAKFRKEAEESIDSAIQSKAKAETLKSEASVGSPKRAGSGFGDKVPRMTCFGTSAAPIPEKKPSLAQRYSAWKVSSYSLV